MLSDNWYDIINNGSDEKIMAILPLIERFASSQGISALLLWPFLKRPDFALRLRTFIALGRMGDSAVLPHLIKYLQQESETHWRLAALDALSFLPGDKSADLGQFIFDEDIIFLCGLIRLLADQGPNALPYLLKFLADDRHNFLQDSLLAEAIFVAAANDDLFLRPWAKKDDNFARWYRHRIKWDGKRRYGIYPYADYMWQQAKQVGLGQKQFKALYWRHRDKKSKN
jgi:hypothetical protein